MAQSELSYDDDYTYVSHIDEIYRDVFNLWPDDGPMQHKKAELEAVLFIGSNYARNTYGLNMYPTRVHPVALREHRRQPTSNDLDNESKEIFKSLYEKLANYYYYHCLMLNQY